MHAISCVGRSLLAVALAIPVIQVPVLAQGNSIGNREDGKHLYEKETFAGNGRTCLTCHTRETGTLAPQQAQDRFKNNPYDPLFLHDGSDDGRGGGATRIQKDATILVEIPLPPNVTLADDPNARSVIVRRGIPSTFNTPALDPVLMSDGRQPDLMSQAAGAIKDHAQSITFVSEKDLKRIAEFELSDAFFSSPTLMKYARGGPAPVLPEGRTESEKRGRLFFVDVPAAGAQKAGICAQCHSGPMLNQTNKFFPVPVPPGTRFQTIGVSEINLMGNPVREFIFTNPDGTKTTVRSADPGRALVTGVANDFPFFNSVNAFKIPTLWGVKNTAPYFHDNSAKTLEGVAAHYAAFFAFVTDPSQDGDPAVILTRQDQADIVAYLKLLE